MKFTNTKIYEHASQLTVFNDCNVTMPVRINFFLQRNIKILTTAAEEIEQTKLSLAAQYGTINSTQTGYDIPSENIDVINRELFDLFNLEQDLNIHIFKLDDFDGIELTYQQMSAIMFMIEE